MASSDRAVSEPGGSRTPAGRTLPKPAALPPGISARPRRRVWCTAVLASFLLLMGGLGIPAAAASVAAPGPLLVSAGSTSAQVRAGSGGAAAARAGPLIAYGDSQAILPQVGLRTALSGLPPCAGGRPEREPAFTRALADAHRLFKGAAVRGAKKLGATLYSGTPGRAEVFAAGAVLDRAPLAALAALLDAQGRAPKNAMLLVNASVFLTELGRPADALALIDRAAELGPVQGAPLGLSNTAIELNDRGFALLGMHSYRAAGTALRAAIRAGGRLLSEASINEAQALNCTGQREQAFHALLAGAYRQKYDLYDYGIKGPDDPQQPSPAELGFTRPTGPPDTLPSLKYPQTNAQAEAASKGFGALTTYLLAQENSLYKLWSSQQIPLYKELRQVSPLTRRRTNEILALINQTGPKEPALTRTYDAAAQAQNNIDDFEAQFSGQNPPSPCPHHAQWLSLIQAWDTAIRNYVAALSKYEAPLVANLGNPLAHEIALEGIRMSDDLELTLLTNNVVNWSNTESKCAAPQPMTAPADKGAKAGDPGGCPDELGPSYKLVLKIPNLAQIKISCDSVEASIEGESLVAPFISGELNIRGHSTFVAGVKAGLELGPFGGGEVQTGFYVKSGPQGIEDFGLRIAPSGSAGLGPPVLIEYGSSVDFSIVGTIAYVPTAFGFR